MFIVEGPAASAVRVANANNGGFQSITTATVSLAGTSTNDYTVGFIAQSGSIAVTPTVGNIGTNTAAGEQTYDTTSGTPYCYLVEDGLSSGGTINVTGGIVNDVTSWIALAVSYVPAATALPSAPPNAIFFVMP